MSIDEASEHMSEVIVQRRPRSISVLVAPSTCLVQDHFRALSRVADPYRSERASHICYMSTCARFAFFIVVRLVEKEGKRERKKGTLL